MAGSAWRSVWLALTIAPALGCGERAAPLPTVTAGHHDMVVDANGGRLPVVLGAATIRICTQVPAQDFQADWQARLRVAGVARTSWDEPARDLIGVAGRRRTLCFAVELDEPPTDAEHGARFEVCGRLRDRSSGRERDLTCRTVVQRAADPLEAELSAELASRSIDRLRTAAARADAAGYPLLATRARLAMVHSLRREGETSAALALLDLLAPWPEPASGDVTARWQGMKAEAAGAVQIQTRELLKAWRALGVARDQFGVIADDYWPMITVRRSTILEHVGAAEEARREVEDALEACGTAKTVCHPFTVGQLRFQRAWLVLGDEDADPPSLDSAARFFESYLEAERVSVGENLLERANSAINLGLARLRQGEEWRPLLDRAEELLAADTRQAERWGLLAGWIRLIRAQAELEEGRGARAAVRCRELAEDAEDLQLAALAFDCAGRAERSTGDLEAAAASYRRALDIWRFANPQQIRQDIAVGAGQRAATTYRAAQVAVDRGRPVEAEAVLRAVDAETATEALRRRCRELATGADLEAWHRLDEERAQVVEALRRLAGPVPGRDEASRRATLAGLAERARELQRELPGCAVETRPVDQPEAAAAEVRAVALGDEVIALFRRPDGSIGADRTPLDRRSLKEILARVEQHLADRDLDDAAWRSLLGPVADALVPAALAVDAPVVTFALHGVLQGVPIAALPLPGQAGWLSERIIPVLRPAAVHGVPAGVPTGAGAASGAPLIVVNPTGELPARTPWGELVPEAVVLARDAATRAAVQSGIARAGWLHIDTHGVYDPAFPELSYLSLSDGRLGLAEVRAWEPALWLANLSGCQTGRWPVSADSGRYGIGGVLAAGEVAWVIASRADLLNTLAEGFNAAFYLALDDDVPRAYAAALEAVRADGARAVEWAALMLVLGNGEHRRSPA